MLIKFVVLSIAIGITLATKCQDIPQHYYELGCTAIKDSTSGACPTRFNCPDFSTYLYNQCNYNGRSYKPGENLKDYVGMLCQENCKCSNGTDGCTFACDDTMCDLNESVSSEVDGKKCIYQKELGVCCAKKKICGSKLIQELPTCKHNNITYYKGEIIYPFQTPCYRCLCDENFQNIADYKFSKRCERVTCGLHLFHMHKIKAGCVPVYDVLNCCPKDDFRCPLLSDKVVPASSGSSSSAECTGDNCCKFGKLLFNVGESVTSPNKEIQCSCQTPPMITCIRSKKYGF